VWFEPGCEKRGFLSLPVSVARLFLWKGFFSPSQELERGRWDAWAWQLSPSLSQSPTSEPFPVPPLWTRCWLLMTWVLSDPPTRPCLSLPQVVIPVFSGIAFAHPNFSQAICPMGDQVWCDEDVDDYLQGSCSCRRFS